MAKTITVELNGQSWAMPASYGASRDIANKVFDPLDIAIKANASGGIKFTVDEIVSVIHIGVTHAGASLTKEQVGNGIFDSEGGVVKHMELVGDYIGLMISGSEGSSGGGEKKT